MSDVIRNPYRGVIAADTTTILSAADTILSEGSPGYRVSPGYRELEQLAKEEDRRRYRAEQLQIPRGTWVAFDGKNGHRDAGWLWSVQLVGKELVYVVLPFREHGTTRTTRNRRVWYGSASANMIVAIWNKVFNPRNRPHPTTEEALRALLADEASHIVEAALKPL